MPSYDIEDFLDDIRDKLIANLNSKVTSIEAEKSAANKGLDPALATFDMSSDSTKNGDPRSFFRQTWINAILNCTPAIFYGLETTDAVDAGGDLAEKFKVFIEVVYLDNGQYNDSESRLFRYTRAVKEIIAEAALDFSYARGLKIEQMRPITMKEEIDSSEEIKISGILITAQIF